MTLYILGIETSCDETALAVISAQCAGQNRPQTAILSNIVYSQIKEHAPFGGVVPEIAARAHLNFMDELCNKALREAGISAKDLGLIAVTQGPGLKGGLLVGLNYAKGLALALNKPFIGVNHLEGHALTAQLSDNIDFPYLLLLVSGGHSQIILVEDVGQYKRLGSTIDDALGEAFDKTAKMLGLPYPGGPYIEKLAQKGDEARFPLPRPLIHEKNLLFSFSGLKTAIYQLIERQKAHNAALGEQDICDICASFQKCIIDILDNKMRRAFNFFKNYLKEREQQQGKMTQNSQQALSQARFVIAGGVGANKAIRRSLEQLCREYDISFCAPPLKLCTDNAAMIAYSGLLHFLAGKKSALDIAPLARWPLDDKASRLFGSGKRGAKV